MSSQKTSSSSKISITKNKIRESRITKNVYRQHQEETIKKYADNKGVLLYHSVGSGKTITALSIYKQILKIKPNIKLVILSESYLKQRWLADTQFLNINQSNIKFYNYTHPDLEELNMKDAILIVDEAHNIIPLMQNEKKYDIIKNLLKAYKIICLTATPIQYSITDISYLLNFVARKDILPYNSDEFRNKFMIMNKTKRNIFGNIYPYLTGIIPIILEKMLNVTYIKKTVITYIISVTLFANLALLSYESFFKLNTDKITKYMKKYISFYSVEEDNAYYPKINTIYHSSAYTTEQYELLLKYSTKQFSPYLNDILKDLSDLKQSKSIKNKETIDPRNIINVYSNYDNPLLFLDKLTVIGNIGDSIKIKNLISFIEKNKTSKHVVYSKFKNLGLNRIKKELIKQNINYNILTTSTPESLFKKIVEEFKTDNTTVILLDPNLTEGIELYGVHHFHLLEPINDYIKFIQVKGRAYRYNSHAHLPLSERVLTYHIWYCNLPEYKVLMYQSLQYKNLFEFVKTNLLSPFFRTRAQRFDFNLSPDELTIQNIKYMEDNIKNINQEFI